MEKITLKQDRVFFESEGDRWFDRNNLAIDKKRSEFDFPTCLIDLIQDKSGIKTIAELGCSNGWRLEKLKKKFPYLQLSGIDASAAAIDDGRKKYPNIELSQGLLADIPLQQEYDIVIVYFVFHWVDRSLLTKSIAEVDRLVKDGGMLILGDFYPDFPQRKHYHHLPEENIFTYKQDYAAIFQSLGIYKEIAKFTGDHDGEQDLKIKLCDSPHRFFCSILHKSLKNYYYEL
jgi:SAM-dependent methyltransferase